MEERLDYLILGFIGLRLDKVVAGVASLSRKSNSPTLYSLLSTLIIIGLRHRYYTCTRYCWRVGVFDLKKYYLHRSKYVYEKR
jgi:hypothetical protein